MASEAQKNQLQSLYIAYFGRPADAAGVTYWTPIIDGGTSFDEIAGRFMDADEFTATSSDLSDVVAAAYANGLNRVASEDEVAFWVGQIEAGDATVASLLEEFRSTDDQTDSQTLENKILVANAYTAAAEAGAEFDTAASVALLAGVDNTQASVDAALEEIGAEAPVDNAELNAALSELKAAQDARAEFLAEVDGDDDAGTSVTAGDLEQAVQDAANEVEAVLTVPGGANYSSVAPAVQAALVAEQEKANAQALKDAQKAVTEANADIAEVSGLKQAVAKLQTAITAAENAEDAAELAVADLIGAEAKYTNLNGAATGIGFDSSTGNIDPSTLGSLFTLNNAGTQVTLAKGITETTNPGVTAVMNAANAAGVAIRANIAAQDTLRTAESNVQSLDPVDTTARDEAQAALDDFEADVATADIVAFEGLVNAYRADTSDAGAATAVENAYAALPVSIQGLLAGSAAADIAADADLSVLVDAEIEALEQAVVDAPTSSLTGALLSALAGVESVQGAIDKLAELVAVQTEAEGNVARLEELDTAIEAALAYFESNDLEAPVLLSGANIATAETDIFVATADNASISGFGFLGDDVLYIGTDYSLNAGALTDGDASVLEVFFIQNGINTEVHLESKAYGSNEASVAETIITLTGVNAADLALSADGFVTVTA